ncbi:MAG: DUF3298 and DUF4163 domain-containing protein [Clostridiales bacterium]|nr:DUF3298 and DUF4163 domain-containing protein [Clostridiales bacterium]
MKKFLSFLILIAVIASLFTGCKKPVKEPDVTPPDKTETQTPPATPSDDKQKVDTRTENRIVSSDDGKKLISIDLSLPSLPADSEATLNVNAYYDNVVEKYLAHAEYDLKPAALEQLKMNAEQGLVFHEYTLDSDYAVTLNTKEYLSISRELDYDTGGANPGVTLNAETFQMSNGGLMNLSDVFSVPKDTYLNMIFKEVISQIEAPGSKTDRSNYFENYKGLVKSSFDPADFYLSPEGITVFYQLYSIAPYAAGVQYFTIPYDKFDGMLKIDMAGK